MTQQQEVLSRIDARIPLSVRDAIDRAVLQGRSHTDFLIAAALEKGGVGAIRMNLAFSLLTPDMEWVKQKEARP